MQIAASRRIIKKAEVNLTTTGLVVELVVIGIGGLLWLLAIAVSIVGFHPIAAVLHSTAFLIPGLSIAYVVGIVLDRIADWLFGPWDRRLRVSLLGSLDEYRRARMLLYGRGTKGIRMLFDYTKSRIRIARAWCLSMALCSLTLPWVALGAAKGEHSRWVCPTVLLAVALAVGSGLSAWSWMRLVGSDYERLRETCVFLLKGPLGVGSNGEVESDLEE